MRDDIDRRTAIEIFNILKEIGIIPKNIRIAFRKDGDEIEKYLEQLREE